MAYMIFPQKKYITKVYTIHLSGTFTEISIGRNSVSALEHVSKYFLRDWFLMCAPMLGTSATGPFSSGSTSCMVVCSGARRN